ncbi:hypothetical protein BJ138DRAFT_1115194 [Hygrophoropsis aurantiaca]|uniref:Uncharacterized protein n=1 Tax=Hygrophoropsis aurantiaca TaxID=72124 RepID=A0ACB8A6W4_9AGAM|nr:hypothetical protein BJ138DRAFT_1115194 [Hygrophoropsis aurantiaca]
MAARREMMAEKDRSSVDRSMSRSSVDGGRSGSSSYGDETKSEFSDEDGYLRDALGREFSADQDDAKSTSELGGVGKGERDGGSDLDEIVLVKSTGVGSSDRKLEVKTLDGTSVPGLTMGARQAETSGEQRAGTSGVQRAGTSGVQRAGTSGVQRAGASGVHWTEALGEQRAGAWGVQRVGTSGATRAEALGVQRAGALGVHRTGPSGIHRAGASGVQQARESGVRIRERTRDIQHRGIEHPHDDDENADGKAVLEKRRRFLQHMIEAAFEMRRIEARLKVLRARARASQAGHRRKTTRSGTVNEGKRQRDTENARDGKKKRKIM